METNIDDVIDAYLANNDCLLELTEKFPQFESELMAFIRFESVLDAIPEPQYSADEIREIEERAIQIVQGILKNRR